MRILMISNLCPPYTLGGYEMTCLQAANALAARGHDILLLTTASHLPGAPDSPFVQRRLALSWFDPYETTGSEREAMLYSASLSDYTNSSAVLQALSEFDPDVAYCWNMFGIGGIGIFDVLKTVGVPWCWHLGDNIPDLLFRFTPAHIRQIFNADGVDFFAGGHIVSISMHLLDLIAERPGFRFPQDVTIIPNGVDTAGLDRRQHYRMHGKTRFISAGRITPDKGIDLILEAAAMLVREGLTTFSIDVFGEGQIAHYVERALLLGVSDRVSFCGGRDHPEMMRLYRDYDALLCPTWVGDALPVTPFEAAASGCVPILTRQCGAAERLVDQVHCLKIDRTAADLAAAMASVVRGEVDLARVGAAGAAMVRSDLSIGGWADRIEVSLMGICKGWDRTVLHGAKMPLLIYAKHHLARSIRLGIEN